MQTWDFQAETKVGVDAIVGSVSMGPKGCQRSGVSGETGPHGGGGVTAGGQEGVREGGATGASRTVPREGQSPGQSAERGCATLETLLQVPKPGPVHSPNPTASGVRLMA